MRNNNRDFIDYLFNILSNMKTLVTDLNVAAFYKRRNEKSENLRAEQGNNTIVLWLNGTKYTAYGQSAYEIGRYRFSETFTEGGVNIATFPKQIEDTFFPKLVRDGYKIAIFENYEE